MSKPGKILFLLLLPVFLLAQEPLENIGNKKDSLLPGTSTTVPVRIENKSAEKRLYKIKVNTSHSDIKPIIDHGNMEIPSGETNFFIVPIRIAHETAQGDYTVSLEITDVSNNRTFTISAPITIARLANITVNLVSAPEYVRAGQSIQSDFLIKNNGNTTETIFVESNTVFDQPKTFQLQPGAIRMVSVLKPTSPNLGKNEIFNTALSVFTNSNPDHKINAYSSTTIISIKPTDDDIYFRYPITASVSYIGMNQRGQYQGGFQAEVAGSSHLKKDHSDMLFFRALTPNPVELSAYTQYEAYFVGYKNKNLYVHLGDKSYSASYLTEFSRYGRGVELRLDLHKFSIGGFFNRPRFFENIKEEWNVFSKFRPIEGIEMTAGYLYKEAPSVQDGTFGRPKYSIARLPYFKTTARIAKNITIAGEIAYSSTDRSEGIGYMLEGQGYLKNITLATSYIKTNPEFAGYFSETNMFNGNGQVRVLKNLFITGNYIQDAKNYQRDTLYLSAPYRKYTQMGLRYQYLQTGYIALYNGFQKYDDRMEQKKFNYEEKFARIDISQKIGAFNVNIESYWGKTNNILNAFSGNSSYYTANLGFDKFNTSINIYGSYYKTSRYQSANQKMLYYGGNIMSRFSNNSYVSLYYQNNYQPEEYYKDRNLFELRYHQRIYKTHSIDLSGRYMLQRGALNNKDFIVSIRYAAGINMPLKKMVDYTTLSGYVMNQGVKKTEGVKLILGNHSTLTDKNGYYIFKNVVPGKYILEIDRSTIDLNDISDIPLPAPLDLVQKENNFNFGLTKAAMIKGRVYMEEAGEKEQDMVFAGYQRVPVKKGKSTQSIIIEAGNGVDVYRKICTLGDEFDFTWLRPGNWKVKVYRNGLDKRYKIAIDHFEFELKANDTHIVNINILKQQSEIRFQQDGIKISYLQKK